MQNINMRDTNDRKADERAGFAEYSAEPALFFVFLLFKHSGLEAQKAEALA